MLAAPAREQIALQAQLLDEVDAAVILLDFSGEHGVVRYWNDGARRLFGYTSEEAIGCVLLDLVTPEENREAELRHRPTVLAGLTLEYETDTRDKYGRVFPVHGRVRPVPPGDGLGPNMYVAVAVDISA